MIKPYGGVYKRPGTLFCGEAKYSDRTAVLARFYFDNFVNYLLEIGDRYIRIWRDGSYLGIELEAPFNLEKSDDGAAWSDFRTYTLVKREVNGVEVRYVERFAKPSSSSRAIEHVCVDSAVRRKYDVPTDEVEFAGRWGGEFGAAP